MIKMVKMITMITMITMIKMIKQDLRICESTFELFCLGFIVSPFLC